MRGVNGKIRTSFIVFSVVLAFSVLIPSQAVWAEVNEQYEFERVDGEDIKNNPAAQDILKKIELSKKILAQMQQNSLTQQLSESQKFVEEQRQIAKHKLQNDLAGMYSDYSAYTPRNAYESFLEGKEQKYHGLYWDQFNYMNDKVQLAKAAKQQILTKGGSYQEAFEAYVKFASMTRVELIKVNRELNIKYGFADPEILKAFDKYGKLPRFDDA